MKVMVKRFDNGEDQVLETLQTGDLRIITLGDCKLSVSYLECIALMQVTAHASVARIDIATFDNSPDYEPDLEISLLDEERADFYQGKPSPYTVGGKWSKRILYERGDRIKAGENLEISAISQTQ